MKMPSDYEHIRINLSKEAWTIIQDDMQGFNINKRSTFVNIIFQNFADDSVASIDYRIDDKKSELENIIDSQLNNREAFIQSILKNEEDKLKKKISKLKKKISASHIYRINNENKEEFEKRFCKNSDTENPDIEYFNYTSFSQYLKCILEDYASRPYLERERIFFCEDYDNVENAIKNENLLEVVTKNNTRYRVYPYSLDADSLSTRLYLTGMSVPIDANSKSKYPASFRIPNLKGANKKKVKIIKNRSGKLSEREKSEMKSAISNRSIQFLVGNEEKIRIRLTDQGIKNYKSQLYMRPKFDPNESTDHEYVFSCTAYQAMVYFFKFGKDAKVISPDSLHEKFKAAYKEAASIYED